MQGLTPTGEIVRKVSFPGHQFEIEKLVEPKMVGAGIRYFRLWHNGTPCDGGQWCYDLPQAMRRLTYVHSCYFGRQVEVLKSQLRTLEREVFVATQASKFAFFVVAFMRAVINFFNR